MLVVALIWGINFSVTKGVFPRFPPLAFTAVRFAVAGALLWPLARWMEGNAPLPPGALRRLIVLGVVGNTFYQLGFITGLERTTASNSALILASMPSIVALLAVALRLEPVRPRVLGGVLVASLGVLLVVAARSEGFSAGSLAGDALTLGAVVCWAGYTLGLRTVEGVSPLRVTAVTTLAGAPGLVLAGVPQILSMDWDGVGLEGWGAFAYATILSLLVAYLIWNRSVQAVGPSRTVVYMCVTPLIAVIAAAVLLGERPQPLQGAGAVLIIAGVVLTRGGAAARSAPPVAPSPSADAESRCSRRPPDRRRTPPETPPASPPPRGSG
ncbi:MAG: DMT family transporter [Gemmatimonadales bacterium]|nr:DMT family transporter [Gemmatimonadales bacterium]